ncbi:MAG: hypothetical protein ASARMPREDX12_006841 [Alectoria sarmentosa]|nr:MAG: hypothetical protein ASARMPREDX12_006841 [Alectoria sarmentosa]
MRPSSRHQSQSHLPPRRSSGDHNGIDQLDSSVATPPKRKKPRLEALATHILDDLNAYISLLLPDPEITAVVSLLATAAPASVLDDLRADPIGYLEFWLAQTTTTPSWVSATLPTPYQAYWLSVQSVEASIIAQDLKAAAATTEATVVTVVEGAPAVTTVVTAGAVGAARIAVEAVGAAVAVGAAGMALL